MSRTRVYNSLLVQQKVFYSVFLERDITIDAYLPKNIARPENLSLLLINDGQDLGSMDFGSLLDDMISASTISPLICIGIHCGEERKMEYGVAYSADYQGLGAKAGLYSKFILDELIPLIRKSYNIASFKEKCFAGFSLGGLSALDIAWNHAREFNKVGIFSGALWWRRRSYEDGYSDDRDRLMHLQVRNGYYYPWMKFFIECGALDETADRNNNGIIDSIDDARDLIKELKGKGYTEEQICYKELPDGRHDVATWAKVMPEFLKWGFSVEN
ncbi:alpha/beta hydrolase-fold protein [Danxiaibacter flavus]|uniref:Alpha/beta hydrolase-fold protein n=1 Tax=Danxiaibacter flavus TaxID=3049108 RepID=A0ABV3ZAX1_9BACT|nr:alpha/beta hydrolase-fold protein [Chitinophagaceae bacterium DXS]